MARIILISLPQIAPYIAAGMGPELKCFREKQHGLLLDYSLRELRGFGELAASRQWKHDEQTVCIELHAPLGLHYPECQAFKKLKAGSRALQNPPFGPKPLKRGKIRCRPQKLRSNLRSDINGG